MHQTKIKPVLKKHFLLFYSITILFCYLYFYILNHLTVWHAQILNRKKITIKVFESNGVNLLIKLENYSLKK